jgi:hypothetical protein
MQKLVQLHTDRSDPAIASLWSPRCVCVLPYRSYGHPAHTRRFGSGARLAVVEEENCAGSLPCYSKVTYCLHRTCSLNLNYVHLSARRYISWVIIEDAHRQLLFLLFLFRVSCVVVSIEIVWQVSESLDPSLGEAENCQRSERALGLLFASMLI